MELFLLQHLVVTLIKVLAQLQASTNLNFQVHQMAQVQVPVPALV